MAQRLTGHIFISYSRKDTLVLRRIVESLRKQGLNIWMDHEQLEPGTPVWEEEIEKAIKGASAIVVLMSPDSKISEWVRREISYSEQYRKHIFPVLVGGDEESSITLRLITRQYVDIRQDEVEGLHLLNATLKAFLEGLNTQEERLAAVKAEAERKAVMPQEVRLTTGGTGGLVEEKSVITSRLSEFAQASRQTETRKMASPHKWSSVLLGTLGWAIAGATGGFIYWTGGEYSVILGGAVGGAIGGLVTAITLYVEHLLSDRKSILWITLAWAVGVAIGWTIGDALTEAIGAAIGGVIAGTIGIVITSRMDPVLSDWKRLVWIAFAWGISWAIGWIISRYFQLNLDAGTIGWTIGIAIGAAIGGFVTTWQVREGKKK